MTLTRYNRRSPPRLCGLQLPLLHVVVNDLLHGVALKFDGELVSIDRHHRAAIEHWVRDQIAERTLARVGSAWCRRRLRGLRFRRRFF